MGASLADSRNEIAMILLISYDLNGHERPAAYARAKRYIEQHAESSIRPLYSQWFVQTDASAEQWVTALRDNDIVDDNDYLFICTVRRPFQGWLEQTHWEWLNSRA